MSGNFPGGNFSGGNFPRTAQKLHRFPLDGLRIENFSFFAKLY